MKDTYHDQKGVLGLAYAAKAKSGSPFTSAAIDLQGFEAATVFAASGELGTQENDYTFKLTECADVGGSYTDVASGDILGTAPVFDCPSGGTAAEDDTVKQFAYVGYKRYIKVVLTVAGAGTGSGIVGATVVKGHPRHAPAV